MVRSTALGGILVTALLVWAGPAAATTADRASVLASPPADRQVEAAHDVAAPSVATTGDGDGPLTVEVWSAGATTSTLTPGSGLGPGEALVSASGRYALVLTEDGDLVLAEAPNRYNPHPVVLSVEAEGGPGSRLLLQGDGNLVLYERDGTVAQSFGTDGSGATRLVMQDDRNVVLYGPGSRVVLDFDLTTFSSLAVGEVLLPGDRSVSDDGRTTLVMQTDGNLVTYADGRAVWQSRTNRLQPGTGAVLQQDGNFVVLSGAAPVFSARSHRPGGEGNVVVVGGGVFRVLDGGSPAVSLFASAWGTGVVLPGQSLLPGDRRQGLSWDRWTLLMQRDGNLVQYADGRPVWQSGTAGAPGARAVMQVDGNFVVYGGVDGRTVLFQTRTAGNPGARLTFPRTGAAHPVQVVSRTGAVLYGS